MAGLRVFVGCPVEPDLADQLGLVQDDLPGRVVPDDMLHVTLAFLGDEVRPEALGALDACLSELVFPQIEVEVDGLMSLGAPPRLVAAELRKADPLARITQQVHLACRDARIDLRRERWRPHVTLTRLPRKLSQRDRDQLDLALRRHVAVRAAGALGPVTLYRSHLSGEGARYEVLAEYPSG